MNSKILTPSVIWNSWFSEAKSSEARIVSYWPGGLVIAALDSHRLPELWVELSEKNNDTLGVKTKPTKAGRGLLLQVESVTVDSRECKVLSIKLGDIGFAETFSSFADLLVDDIFSDKTLSGKQVEVELKIAKWVDFFSSSKSRISREAILGLIGELHFIDQWLDSQSVKYSCWTGPLGESKDFRGENIDVEVKVTGNAGGPLVHKISSLDQLQPIPTKQLYLFSMRVALGSKNKFRLEDLINKVCKNPIFSDRLASSSYFAEAISRFDFDEGIAEEYSTFEILDERIFLVNDDFPRVRRESFLALPEITSLQYNLDLTSVHGITDFNRNNPL